MQPVEKKKRNLRAEQDAPIVVHEDENAHLWAVSYSDFLMALLSFFILFFSIDTPQRQKLILDLADTFSTAKSGHGGGVADGKGSRMPAQLMDSLKDLQLEATPEKDSLTVHFADDFFLPGQHVIAREHAPAIRDFLKLLRPYQGKVNLYFEGHADRRPLQKAKNDIVVDNFILSSLRASSALILAKQMGFSEKHLFIRAASSNVRDTRSLSVLIEPREENSP